MPGRCVGNRERTVGLSWPRTPEEGGRPVVVVRGIPCLVHETRHLGIRGDLRPQVPPGGFGCVEAHETSTYGRDLSDRDSNVTHTTRGALYRRAGSPPATARTAFTIQCIVTDADNGIRLPSK